MAYVAMCLQVNFEFDQVPAYTDIAHILTPQIPVRGLYIWSGYVEEDDWRVGYTLNHIANHFSKTIGQFAVYSSM